MTKHDTWIKVDDPIFEKFLPLFPNGIPARDPFPMALQALRPVGWIIDNDRLSPEQLDALYKAIAKKHGESIETIRMSHRALGYIGIHNDHVESVALGVEGFTRLLQFLKFCTEHPPDSPDSERAVSLFLDSQYDRWVTGDSIPDLQTTWEQTPEECKDEAIRSAFNKLIIQQTLNMGEYSALDFLLGKPITDALIKVDPDYYYEMNGDKNE